MTIHLTTLSIGATSARSSRPLLSIGTLSSTGLYFVRSHPQFNNTPTPWHTTCLSLGEEELLLDLPRCCPRRTPLLPSWATMGSVLESSRSFLLFLDSPLVSFCRAHTVWRIYRTKSLTLVPSLPCILFCFFFTFLLMAFIHPPSCSSPKFPLVTHKCTRSRARTETATEGGSVCLWYKEAARRRHWCLSPSLISDLSGFRLHMQKNEEVPVFTLPFNVSLELGSLQ